MRAFRHFCLECMGGSPLLVRECDKGDCPIHPYRFGKNPNRKGASKEQMTAIRPPETLFSTDKSAQKRFEGSGSREWIKTGIKPNFHLRGKVDEEDRRKTSE